MDAVTKALFDKLAKTTRTAFNGCGRCKWADLCIDFIRLRLGGENITCKDIKRTCEYERIAPDDWDGFLRALGFSPRVRPIPQEQWEKENLREVVCKCCGKTFEIMKGEERGYCSADCKKKARAKPLAKRVCPVCHKEFEFRYSARRTYCSVRCLFQARRDRMLINNPKRKKGEGNDG